MTNQPSDAWLASFCQFNNVADHHRPTMTQMLGSIAPAACFLTMLINDQPAAVGLAIAERDHVGLFDLVVAPEQRRQGIGQRLVHHLLAWGKAQGAAHAYLQVMNDNAAARRLYARLGFREAYAYWYRVKPLRA